MRAFIVCADNEPEWLLYDGQAGAHTRERRAFKTYQIVPAPPNGLPVLPKIHKMSASRSGDTEAHCQVGSSIKF